MTTVGQRTYPLAYVSYGDEEIDAVVETLRSGRTTCGPRVQEFEQQFARYVGSNHAIMVNSGSSADLLVAFGLGPAEPGDEVLVPAVTWPTQVWSCLLAGYLVRLVDVDPQTLQFDLDDLEQKVTSLTKAVFPVHVLGNVGDLDGLLDVAIDSRLAIIEDCCEALGARYNGAHVGTFGDAAAFSFFFSHLINTMEGGMVVTDSDRADHDYRLWRAHGWEPTPERRFSFSTWGMNLRPTELQGAFGTVQLGRLEGFRKARQRNFERLTSSVSNEWLTGVTVLPECEPSWHGYPLMVAPDGPIIRGELCRYLDEYGIETRPIIAGNLARQLAVRHEPRITAGDLPGADVVHDQGFYIGLASFDDVEGTAYVAQVIEDFVMSR